MVSKPRRPGMTLSNAERGQSGMHAVERSVARRLSVRMLKPVLCLLSVVGRGSEPNLARYLM